MAGYNSVSQFRKYRAVPLVVFMLLLAAVMVYHVLISEDKPNNSDIDQPNATRNIPNSVEELVANTKRKHQEYENIARLSKKSSSSSSSSTSGGGGGAKKTSDKDKESDEDTHSSKSTKKSADFSSSLSSSSSNSNYGSSALQEPPFRLTQYCSEHVPPGVEGATKFPAHEHYILQDLIIAIRHGDRSGIHIMPGSEKKKTLPTAFAFPALSSTSSSTNSGGGNSASNTPASLLMHPEIKPSISKLSHFELKILASEDTQIEYVGENVTNVFNPRQAFVQSDFNLSQGQLTSRGFKQHLDLGQLLHASYKTFLTQIHSTEEIYIRSTNYKRTLLSVSALLINTLPQFMSDKYKDKVPIYMYENELDEVMHGIGLKASSHAINHHGEGITEIFGKCHAAITYAKSQMISYVRKAPIFEKLAKAFGGVIRTTSTPELVDSAMPSFCHNLPLPCSKDTTSWIEKYSQDTIVDVDEDTSTAAPVAKVTTLPVKKHSGGKSSSEEEAVTLPTGVVAGGTNVAAVNGKALKGRTSTTTTTTTTAASTSKGKKQIVVSTVKKDRCLQNNHVLDMMLEADQFYCERFSGSKGGLNSTNLAMFPFMQEILAHLKDSVKPLPKQATKPVEASNHSNHAIIPKTINQSKGKKLSIFSGHDTVLGPVLAALGVFHDSMCYWPSYASRIVFELYSVAKVKQSKSISVSDLQGKAAAYLKKLTDFKVEYHTFDEAFEANDSLQQIQKRLDSEHYVRVVYNGLDITSRIPACLHERVALAKAITKKDISSIPDRDLDLLRLDFPLCSLISFEEQVMQMIAPFPDLTSACNATKTK